MQRRIYPTRFGQTPAAALAAITSSLVGAVVWGALPKPTGKEVIADEDFFAAATAVLR